MFSSIGWGEVLVVVIVGIIVIGPERLPRLITDIRATIKAARDAIGKARRELDDEFGDDFEEFRKPLSQLNDVRQMGAKGLISKTLLDGDDTFLTDLEASARSVSDAATGRGVDTATTAGAGTPGTAAVAGAPAESGTPQASPAPTVAEEPDGSGSAQERPEPRVELPQQQDAGTSRDWGSGSDYDDAI